jgi:hypothetical protein
VLGSYTVNGVSKPAFWSKMLCDNPPIIGTTF